MIYPGTYDIKLLQNSTWKGQFRAASSAQSVTIDVGTATFTADCHGLLAGDAVCFAPATSTSKLPCGLKTTDTYYVISTGLTTSQFKVSATVGGASVAPTGTAVGTFTVSKPVDLTGYTVDSDVKGLNDGASIVSFATTITDAVNGKFELSLQPSDTLALETGRYGYDVSLTSLGGERYYWITGVVTLEKTYSRN